MPKKKTRLRFIGAKPRRHLKYGKLFFGRFIEVDAEDVEAMLKSPVFEAANATRKKHKRSRKGGENS